jgi:hypothetical protein
MTVTFWVYEVQVVGDLNDRTLSRIRAELGDVSAISEPASTQLTISLPDQAGLLGLLDRLQALGLTLREVHRLSAPERASSTGSRSEPPRHPPDPGSR